MKKRLREGRHTWVKLWCEQWLTGSTRFELSPIQRAIWIDFLALGGRSKTPGIIAASLIPESLRGYPLKWLAGILMVSEAEVEEALNQFTATGKVAVQRDPVGGYIIHLVNWAKYQSEYQRQKPYRRNGSSGQEPPGLQPELQPPLRAEARSETLEARSEKENTPPACPVFDDPKRFENAKPSDIPVELRELAFRVYGHEPAALVDWMLHPLQEIRDALYAADAGKKGVAWVTGRLRNRCAEGYPAQGGPMTPEQEEAYLKDFWKEKPK